MTILVDEPRWEWQGTTWAHLVSDTSVGELHRFARTVGVRYLSYQGDHYDLPVGLLDRAVEAGAEMVGSREVVRRLRAAGLRHRAGKSAKAWTLLAEGDPDQVSAVLDPASAGLLNDVWQRHRASGPVTLLGRPDERVGLLRLFDHASRLGGAVEVVHQDCVLVESRDPRGHALEVVWRSGAGRELHHG